MNTKYTKAHDIDWFYIISGIPVHVASAGGELPIGINSMKQLRIWQRQVDDLLPKASVVLNKEYVRQIIQNDYKNFEEDLLPPDMDLNRDMDAYNLTMVEKCYYNTFFSMAQRGFYSFDRNIEVDDKDVYHLVAKPTDGINMDKIGDFGIPCVEISGINLDFSTTAIPLTQLINQNIKKQ